MAVKKKDPFGEGFDGNSGQKSGRPANDYRRGTQNNPLGPGKMVRTGNSILGKETQADKLLNKKMSNVNAATGKKYGGSMVSPRGARGAYNGKPGSLTDDFLYNSNSVQKLEAKGKKKK